MTAKTAAGAAKSPKHAPATKKHAATRKHTESAKTRIAAAKKSAATRKANKAKVTAKAKPATHAKAVGFAVGDLLPVCAFEAVAQSLRLAGQPVHDDEVAELWHLLGGRPEGVPVGEALAAVALFGLAGCRPALGAEPFEAGRADEGFHSFGPDRPDVEFPAAGRAGAVGVVKLPVLDGPVVAERVARGHGLILRIDVPGPHAVLATPDGWWSWGELLDPWPCRVEQAWAVSWS